MLTSDSLNGYSDRIDESFCPCSLSIDIYPKRLSCEPVVNGFLTKDDRPVTLSIVRDT